VAASGVNGRTTPIRISAVTLYRGPCSTGTLTPFGQLSERPLALAYVRRRRRTMNESVRRLRSQISGAPNLVARHCATGNRAPWRPTRTYWAKVQ
jgi:hypothetical protein